MRAGEKRNRLAVRPPDPQQAFLFAFNLVLAGLFTIVFAMGGLQRGRLVEGRMDDGAPFVIGTIFVGLLSLRAAFGLWGLPRLGLLEWVCIVLQTEGMTIFALDLEILNSPLKHGMGAWLTLICSQTFYLGAAGAFSTWLLTYLNRKARSSRGNRPFHGVARIAVVSLGFPLLIVLVTGACWVAWEFLLLLAESVVLTALSIPFISWLVTQRVKWLFEGRWNPGPVNASPSWRPTFLPQSCLKPSVRSIPLPTGGVNVFLTPSKKLHRRRRVVRGRR